MKTLSLVLLSLFLLTLNFCPAQNKSRIIILCGSVFDENNVRVEAANVSDLKSKAITRTNTKGNFYLPITKVSLIHISHVGYYTLEKTINTEEFKNTSNDSLILKFILRTEIVKLQTVEISGEKIKDLYGNESSLILDYEFDKDNNLLLLMENEKRYKIKIFNSKLDSASEIQLKIKPEKFYRDCLDNFHLVCKDSVYQMYIHNLTISLLKPYSKELINEKLVPCAASTKRKFYHKYYGPYNQSVFYISIDKITHKNEFIQQSIDEKSQGFADFYLNNVYNKDDDEAKFEDGIFLNKTLSKPLFCPLLKIRDSIFIFNHVDSVALVYNPEGIFIRQFKIRHQYRKGWKEEFIQDYAKQEIYTKCIRDGILYLLKINLDNGDIIKEYEIENHVFPVNVKVNNGFVYFLYRDKNGGNSHIYYQKLE